jgi:hypothetical protein
MGSYSFLLRPMYIFGETNKKKLHPTMDITFFIRLFSLTLLLYTQENTGTWVFSGRMSIIYLGLSSKRARTHTLFKRLDNGRKATIF